MESMLKGLTDAQVQERVKNKKVNTIPNRTSKSVPGIILGNIFNYFNLIFAIIAVLLIMAGSYRNLTFLPVVISNILLGIIQQLRAKSVLDKLSVLALSEYTVIRDGSQVSVAVNALVLDDLVILKSGQQIPADATVVEGAIMANEALLTGESDEVEKTVGSALKSGSFVVSGECVARLTQVGAESYAAQLQAKAKEIKEKPSEMIQGINLIIKVSGIAIIPVGAALFFQALLVNHETFQASVTSMVGAVIGMIPEGLYLLVTVALALSAARLAMKRVLLHDMRSTETLARVDVLCVDKTGTITDNEMHVTEVFAPAGQEGALKPNTALLSAYVSAINDVNITMAALKRHFADTEPMPATAIQSFSSKTKYSQIETADTVYRLGAPEILLASGALKANQAIIDERAGRGQRVLAFVGADHGESDFRPLAFISLENGLRPNVAETFAYFRNQEVAVKVISGDNPLTVSRIAQGVGIPGAESYVDASTLDTPEAIRDAVARCTVFGRVKPEQKKDIVEALKAQGSKVAMTGDGVNDILAMKEADCSIAMGAGSDAARQAAQVVLLDSDFSHMKEIIGEGRRDINNITRSATLFLYKNIFSMLLALMSILLAFSYPLQPSQVSLVTMFNIGIPAFALALEPNERKQKPGFLRQVLLRALPAALASFLSIAAMMGLGQVFELSSQDISVAGTYLLSVVGFLILIGLCRPMNNYRAFVLIFCVLGFICAAHFLGGLFAIEKLSLKAFLLCVLLGVAEESLMRNIGYAIDRLDERLAQHKAETRRA